ncbi:hypothetical protein A2U01_0038020, partial [Trifolium medium]|nr:hypothetical protein [Trifolium medium]
MLESILESVLSSIINNASPRDATDSFQEQCTSTFTLFPMQIQLVLQHQPQASPCPSNATRFKGIQLIKGIQISQHNAVLVNEEQ